MANQIITIDKIPPHYILESGEGIYEVVSSYEKVDGIWVYNTDSEMGELELGMDIEEITARGISLIVRSVKFDNCHTSKDVIPELKKFGRVTNSDYVSMEPFGGDIMRELTRDGQDQVYEVRPRLFRKIRNN